MTLSFGKPQVFSSDEYSSDSPVLLPKPCNVFSLAKVHVVNGILHVWWVLVFDKFMNNVTHVEKKNNWKDHILFKGIEYKLEG